jgi:hypothetical protein
MRNWQPLVRRKRTISKGNGKTFKLEDGKRCKEYKEDVKILDRA